MHNSKYTREDGTEVTIEWEIGGVIDRHDGCTEVWLTGTDYQGREYEAEGSTLSGELEDVTNIEEK